MSGKTQSFSGIKKCILRCKDSTQLFDFPSEAIFCKLWLYKLGLKHFDASTRVCEKHFTEDMLLPSGDKLKELAVPNQNLPETLVKKNLIYEQFLKKIRPRTAEKKVEKKVRKKRSPKKPRPKKNVESTTEKNVPKENATPTDDQRATSPPNPLNLLNDSSKLLMDYKLVLQGKHMCDVVEIPQYIVVFTVLKPKELKPVPLTENEFLQVKSKENINPLLKIPPSITVSRPVPEDIFLPMEDFQSDGEDNSPTGEPEIKYVYYMTGGGNPRRERQIQVDGPKTTKETSVQCDVGLDNDMVQMISYTQFNSNESHVSEKEISKDECLECGEIMANHASKQKHESKHEKNRSLCPHCGKIFSNEFKLNSHERLVHSEKELLIKKALRCPKLHCKKAFHSRRQLNDHIDNHMRKVEYKCCKCLRLFTSSLKLHSHQKAFKNCLKKRCPSARK